MFGKREGKGMKGEGKEERLILPFLFFLFHRDIRESLEPAPYFIIQGKQRNHAMLI